MIVQKLTVFLINVMFLGYIESATQRIDQIEQITTVQSINDRSIESNENSLNQRCDDARLKCAFRLDCGQALTSYMIHCTDLIAGTISLDQCPVKCFRALIALASTEHGSKLVDCDCGDSQFCKLSKERIEICREKVEHEIAENTVVSCSTAKFICSSNTQCLTALTYYNKFCKAMFMGKYCSKRCLNSLQILQRQTNAHKLRTCICDGSEDFPCETIKQNTESLCLKKANLTTDTSIELLNDEDQPPKKHRNHHKKYHFHSHKFEHNRRPFLRHRQRHHSSDLNDDDQFFETSPIDLEQIKNFKYLNNFDIMVSEALSSNVNRSSIHLICVFMFSMFNFRFLMKSISGFLNI